MNKEIYYYVWPFKNPMREEILAVSLTLDTLEDTLEDLENYTLEGLGDMLSIEQIPDEGGYSAPLSSEIADKLNDQLYEDLIEFCDNIREEALNGILYSDYLGGYFLADDLESLLDGKDVAIVRNKNTNDLFIDDIKGHSHPLKIVTENTASLLGIDPEEATIELLREEDPNGEYAE